MQNYRECDIKSLMTNTHAISTKLRYQRQYLLSRRIRCKHYWTIDCLLTFKSSSWATASWVWARYKVPRVSSVVWRNLLFTHFGFNDCARIASRTNWLDAHFWVECKGRFCVTVIVEAAKRVKKRSDTLRSSLLGRFRKSKAAVIDSSVKAPAKTSSKVAAISARDL